MIYHGLAGAIWFNANQYEVPVIQNGKYFPDYLPSWNGWNDEPSPYGAVAYQNWLHLTFKDHVLSYDPRIQDGTQDFVITPISEVNGAPLIDNNLMYVPTESKYQVYDISIPNKPIFFLTTPLPTFIPRYIKNGVAYGMYNDMVAMQLLIPFKNDVYQLVPMKLIDINEFERFEVLFPINVYTNSHPELYRDRELELIFQDYSIILSDTYDRFFQRDLNRFIYIHDINFDPENPEYVEAYSVNANVGPYGKIEGNILILYNDDETFYFRLGGDLFSTSIPNWQVH